MIPVRRVHENLATVNSRRIVDAMSVADHDELDALFAEDCTYLQYELGESSDRAAHLDDAAVGTCGWASGDRAPGDAGRPSRARTRVGWWFPSMKVGESTTGDASMELLVVTEVDEEGRATWTAGFPTEELGAAIVTLYRRLGQPQVAALLDGLVVEDVIELTASQLLLLVSDAGAPGLRLWLLGPEGSAIRSETFAPDELDAAVGLIDDLAVATVPTAAFENAADRIQARFVEAWAARDWEGVVETVADGYRSIDRRAHVHLESDRDEALATTRLLFDTTGSDWRSELLATRGDRLALFRLSIEIVDRSSGPSDVEFVTVNEVDEAGLSVRAARFDADDLDAAFDELNARFAAGERADAAQVMEWETEFRRAFLDRDWDRFEACFEPDFIAVDHRPLGWGAPAGRRVLRQPESAPRTRARRQALD